MTKTLISLNDDEEDETVEPHTLVELMEPNEGRRLTIVKESSELGR
jgi:hypothetical protein